MYSEPKLAKCIRWLIYGVALVPLVIFAQYLSPFHFGKVIVFRTIVQIMTGLYVLLIVRDRSYFPKSNPITWGFFAFTLAFTLTTFTSVAFLQSWWGTLERMGGLFTFWHYFIFFLILISVMRTKEHWQILIDLMVSAGLVSALYGFLQKTNWGIILGSGGRQRVFGTIGNPALFAGYQILIGYLAATVLLLKRFGPRSGVSKESATRGILLISGGLLAVLVLSLAFSGHGLWVIPFGVVFYGIYLMVADLFGVKAGVWMYGIAAVTMIFAAGSTAVRGSLLGMVVATLVGVMLWAVLNKSRGAKNALLGLLSLVIVFVFLGMLLRSTPLVQNSPYLRRITDFSSQTFTVKTRFWAWSAGLHGWSDAPRYMLVGWGPENFNVPFSKYFNPKFFTGPGAETFFDRAHNMFMEVLVTMGIVGELAYLSVFAMLFWTLAKFMKSPDNPDLRTLGIGLTSLTVAYIIHNAFIFDTSANFIAFFMILGFVVHVSLRGLEAASVRQTNSMLSRWSTAQVGAATIIAVGVLMLVYTTNIRPSLANFASTRAILAGWDGNLAKAVQYYRKAIAYNSPGRYEFRGRFTQYLLDASGSNDTTKVSGFNDFMLEAIDDLQKNIEENPLDYLPLLYTSRMYSVLGAKDSVSPYNDRAIEYANRALTISPTFVRTYYELAQAYMNKKDYDKAYTTFQKAYELNPNVQLTRWYMAIAEIARGNTKEALEIIHALVEEGYALSESDTLKVINGYIKLGDIKNVAFLYEQLVKNFPQNATYWAQLAAADASIGKIQEAIIAVRRAMKLNPDPAFQEQAKQFLRELGATP